jgi:hypothetical protein
MIKEILLSWKIWEPADQMQCILDTQSNSSSKSKKLTPYGASMTHYPGGLRQPPAPSPATQLEHASGRHSIHPRAGPTQMGWCTRDAGPPRHQNRLRHRHLQDHRQSNDPASRQSWACRWAALLQRDPQQLPAHAAEQCHSCLSLLGEIALRHAPQAQPPVQVVGVACHPVHRPATGPFLTWIVSLNR